MEANLVLEALKFMVLGMTTVFSFLILMVFVLKAQAKIVNKYFPQKSKTQTKSTPVQAVANNQNDASVIAAITAAITEFKKRN